MTALLCDLDLATGLFTWIPCGHPPPLLVRGGRAVRELARTARPPLGLADFIVGHGSTSLPPPETMRRLNQAVLSYQDGRLSDDATAVLIEWQPAQPGRHLTP